MTVDFDKITKEIDVRLIELGKERDKIRQMISDLESYEQCADEAIDTLYDARNLLERAADSLSQYV